MTLWALAIGGLVLAGLGLALILRGRTVPEEPKTPPAPVEAQAGKPLPPAPPKVEPKTSGESDQPPDFTAMIGAGGAPEGENIRESAAQRELDRIKDFEATPNANPFEVYQKLQHFSASFGTTKAGRSIADRLKNMEAVTTRPPDPVGQTEPGLLVQLYESPREMTLRDVVLTAYKQYKTITAANVDLPTKDDLKTAYGRNEYVIAEYTGYVEAPTAGTYTFHSASDDASLLYVGSLLVVNNDGKHPKKEVSEVIPLKAGKHRIRLLYWQGSGEAALNLSWTLPESTEKQIIPASAFSHNK